MNIKKRSMSLINVLVVEVAGQQTAMLWRHAAVAADVEVPSRLSWR
jgi:hypothetical protein